MTCGGDSSAVATNRQLVPTLNQLDSTEYLGEDTIRFGAIVYDRCRKKFVIQLNKKGIDTSFYNHDGV